MISQKVATPVKTGVQIVHKILKLLDSGFRRNDEKLHIRSFYEFIIFTFSNFAKKCPVLNNLGVKHANRYAP
jgi:hypothetical protein